MADEYLRRQVNRMEGQTICLAQTLHGYADGHQLLAGTLSLSKRAARLMNILSDLSGPEVVDGFESYLTGYPIPDLRKYALARTWYAPEMKRPGCVWTHTLLIDFADLAQIDDLRMILRYFKRPAVDERDRLEQYQEPISVDMYCGTAEFINESSDIISETDAIGILSGLYGQPEKSVVLLAATAKTHQDFMLRLWSQQWPRLRRAFSFTTGALSLRQDEEEGKFDLQVYPKTLQKQLQHVLRTESSWLVVDSTKIMDAASWLTSTLADLNTPNQTRLRDFLWRSGVYVKDGRASFAPLVRISDLLSQLKAEELESLLALLAELFPQPELAAGLKKALLGVTPHNVASWVPGVTEMQVLSTLTKTQYYSAFDPAMLGVDERASRLMRANRSGAIRLAESLLETNRTPLAKEYLASIIQNISGDELVVWAQRDMDFVADVITLKPSLASDVNVWRSLSYQRPRLLASLFSGLGRSAIDELLPVLLEANADGLADDLANLASPEALVGGFLQWFDQQRLAIDYLPNGWLQYLSYQHTHILSWLRQQSIPQFGLQTSLLLARILNPHDDQVIQLGAGLWERLATKLDALQSNSSQQRVAAFLLSLGFHNPSPSGAALVSHAFAPIYIAARESRLDEKNWGLLRQQAPSEWFLEDWDKCVRLTRALLTHFVRYDWPKVLFADSLKDDEMWHTVRKCSWKHSSWRRYIRQVSAMLEEPDTSSAE